VITADFGQAGCSKEGRGYVQDENKAHPAGFEDMAGSGTVSFLEIIATMMTSCFRSSQGPSA
jgi:hypothetical protein